MRTWWMLVIGCVVPAAALITLVAPADASECAGRQRPANELTVERAERLVDCVIDRERRARELAALRSDGRLAEAAATHSRAMVVAGVFAHVLPNGPDLSDRVRRTGYLEDRREWQLGEVLAWATLSASSPVRLVRSWLNSPAHREIVLANAYDELGVGIVRGTPRDPNAVGFTAAVVLAG